MTYPLNVDVVRNDTKKYLARMEASQVIFSMVRIGLHKFDGKKITKRLATTIETLLVDHIGSNTYHVFLDTPREYLYIWGGEISYDNRTSIYLGDWHFEYSSIFNFDVWSDKYSKQLNVAREIANSKKALQDVERRVSVYNAALEQLENAAKELDGLKYR